MQKIVLGYDGSHAARAAMDELVCAFLPDSMEAVVMSVAEVWLPADELNKPVEAAGSNSDARTSEDPYARPRSILNESRNTAWEGAQRLTQKFPHWKVDHEAVTGSPGWEIVQKAHDWQADLVVVGAHSNSSVLERLFFGTTASRVAAEATCSVRIARPRARKSSAPLRVFMAVDASEDSRLAVKEVEERQWPKDTRFIVGTVIDPKMESNLHIADNRALPWLKERFQGTRDLIRRIGAHYTEELKKKFNFVESHVWEGDPKKVILREIEHQEVDCIFLGARGTEHGEQWRLGSVASAITSRASCTVEIIRPSRRTTWEK